MVEVVTDASGRATADIVQQSPAPGTNQVNIQVIRPATSGAGGRQIAVGTGSVLQTWTGEGGAPPTATVPGVAAPSGAASGISLHTRGPSQAGVGSTVTYHIQLSNPGGSPGSGVVVTDEVPPGLTYLNSNPAATGTSPGGQQWQMGDLAPGSTQTIEVNYRVDQPGSLNYCGAFTAAGGQSGRDCVTTVAAPGQLNVSILGPQTAEVGAQVTFTIDIANQSDGTATHVIVSDRFDPGLEHAVATGAIVRDLQDDIPPRQSRQLAVTFRVAEPGQLCQDVTITADGGLRSEARSCLTVPDRQAPAVVPPLTTPPTNPQLPPANVPPTNPPPATVPPTTGQLPGALRRKTRFRQR